MFFFFFLIIFFFFFFFFFFFNDTATTEIYTLSLHDAFRSIAHPPPGARRSCCSKRACEWRASMCAPCGRSACRSSWRVPWPRRPPAVGEQLSILRLIAQASVPVQIVI